MEKYSCYLISNKFHLFSDIEKGLKPETLNFFDGTNAGSFSKLVNKCAAACPTEIVIMMSDKVRPNSEHVYKILNLLDEGYALVGLYRFAFFGFKKELFRKIGPLDERFISGGYEDDDFYIRLKEANLAAYLTEEIPYKKSISSWNHNLNKPYFIEKWIPHFDSTIKFHNNKIKRRLPEETYDYDWGDKLTSTFLSWDKSYIPVSKGKKFTGSPK